MKTSERPSAFFVPERGGYVPTALAIGPWSVTHLHGGPPAALLVRALEAGLLDAGPGRLVRVGVELGRPVPLAPLTVDARVVRPGRKVRIAEATLRCGDDVVASARALWLRQAAVELPAGPPGGPAPPDPTCARDLVFPFFDAEVSYRDAIDVRIGRGTFGSGDTLAWMRLRVPVVEGETPSPWQRVLAVADAANGTTACLDHRRYAFVNPDLTVFLWREPAGEWVGLDGAAHPQPDGTGLVDVAVLDTAGPVGRAVQSVLIDRRG